MNGPDSADEEGPGLGFPPGFVAIADSGLLGLDPGYRRWRLRPGLDLRWNGTTFRTNALGYRGPEVDVEKTAGAFRVVVLGSSITMGHGIEDERGYVRLFERWLAGVAGPRGPVEVVNLAAPGEAPSQRLLRFRTEVEALDADWVLCDATPVDVVFEEQHLHSMVSRGVPIPFAYVREVIARAEVAADAPIDEFLRKIRPFRDELLAGAFAGWAAKARRLGVPLTVVLLPRTDTRGNSPILNEMIRGAARRNGLGLVDLTAAFDGLDDEELVVGPWDKHPSVAGHRALFLGLRDAASRPGVVPWPSEPRRRSLVRGGRPQTELISTRRRTLADAVIRRRSGRSVSRLRRSRMRTRTGPRANDSARPSR
jgi:hypothetical protein